MADGSEQKKKKKKKREDNLNCKVKKIKEITGKKCGERKEMKLRELSEMEEENY